MKRIALCLYGNFNNRLASDSGLEGTKYIKETILKNRNVDIFIHSWDLAHKSDIESNYAGFIKDCIIEKQIDFSGPIKESGIDENKFVPPGGETFRTIANSFSFFYSRGKAIELKRKHELASGIKYDVVVCSRFDLGQIDKHNGYQEFKVSEIDFNEDYDMNYFYSAMYNQLNAGYADMWFYSSSENMDKLSLMYAKTFGYLQSDSEYLKTLEAGWPDSNAHDEFSNEMLKPATERAKTLKRYPAHEAHNNHIMHKWFLMDVGLYEKSKFLVKLSSKFCSLVYSHSDYSDIWPAYFQQLRKYSKIMGPKFLFTDKPMRGVPEDVEQILYDSQKSYPERMVQGLTQLRERGFEVCLYEHEDMILYKAVDFAKLKVAINHVFKPRHGRPFRNGFDSIRLIKSTGTFSLRTLGTDFVHWMMPFSKWLFSVQPTIWKIDSFIQILELHKGNTIWELELKAQKTCRKLGLKCGYMHTNGKRRGLHHWDNEIYPYIATAIVKGKWNFSEYPEDLTAILREAGIDPTRRGKA